MKLVGYISNIYNMMFGLTSRNRNPCAPEGKLNISKTFVILQIMTPESTKR